jgi:hypothetical protein
MKNKIPNKLKLDKGPKRLNLGCGFKYMEGWMYYKVKTSFSNYGGV